MSRDPYSTLGLSKTASVDEIKSAYRKLAKKYHPDVNPGRKDILEKFKEITAAYDLLSDEDKRKRYDRGEVDGMGNPRAYERSGTAGSDPFGAAGAHQWRSYRGSAQNPGGEDDPFSAFGEDLFADLFGGQSGKKRRGGFEEPRGPQPITQTISISFNEACLGGKRRVTLAGNKTIEVNIPPGTDDGAKLRLKGAGPQGQDVMVEIGVEKHPHFTRKGFDLTIDVPISLPEAVLGASIKVPTLDGSVQVKVPKGSNSGAILRLKGKGVPKGTNDAGDLYVKLKISLPDAPDKELSDWVERWGKKHDYDPRKKMGWFF